MILQDDRPKEDTGKDSHDEDAYVSSARLGKTSLGESQGERRRVRWNAYSQCPLLRVEDEAEESSCDHSCDCTQE